MTKKSLEQVEKVVRAVSPIEVKKSGKLKEEHIEDVALQSLILADGV